MMFCVPDLLTVIYARLTVPKILLNIMDFLFEPAFWTLLAASLTAWSSTAFLRPIGRIRLASLLTVWIAATGTTGLLYGAVTAIISAIASLLAGLAMLSAVLVWSGVKSMPNRRFEER